MLRGTVTEFDDTKGLGVIAGEDGLEYRFHCVEILDGTRTIAVGQAVTFHPLRRFGRVQAGGVGAR